jgi:hypothetical protein
MLNQTDRKDITFAFTAISLAMRSYAGIEFKFGKGWMGKDAEINHFRYNHNI